MPETGPEKQKNMVIVFPTTHLTLKAESILEKGQVDHRTVMKPRKISSDCGLAIRIGYNDLDRTRGLLEEHSMEVIGFFVETGQGWDQLYPGEGS